MTGRLAACRRAGAKGTVAAVIDPPQHLGFDPEADLPLPRRKHFAAGGCCSAGSQLSGPSRLAGFSLVGFGAEVASGSSDSTMAISSPGSRSELRDGRR
jgi:hypothetical protein